MSEILAGYIYLKSKATADSDFGLFMATKKLGKVSSIETSISGALIPWLQFYAEFTSVVLKVDRKSFLRRRKSSAVP